MTAYPPGHVHNFKKCTLTQNKIINADAIRTDQIHVHCSLLGSKKGLNKKRLFFISEMPDFYNN